MTELVHVESQIKKSICEFLEKFPDRILFTVTPPKRTKYTSKFMKNGWPDIFGVLQHADPFEVSQGLVSLREEVLPFFIEVKKPGGTLSLEQHKILEQAKAMGAITCVAVSVECVRKALGL